MKLTSHAFADNASIPSKFAFCKPDPATHAGLSDNLSPDLAWSDLPPGTKSLVLLCCDPDVPSEATDVNQEGRTIPKSLARIDFFHWVLVDLPPVPSVIAEGDYSRGFTARGKPGPAAPGDARHGLNDYTGWFAGHGQMAGQYFGYDGPFPPFNDSLVHHYVFTLYAVAVPRLPLEGVFTGPDVRQQLAGRVLGEATFSGTYTLNQRLLDSGC
jgi:Raf kinase inhibitor-like YbhB/YbcL family protein